MLSIYYRCEVAIGEIERLNELRSTRVEAAKLDAAMDEIKKLRSALRHQIMVYQVDDYTWIKMLLLILLLHDC